MVGEHEGISHGYQTPNACKKYLRLTDSAEGDGLVGLYRFPGFGAPLRLGFPVSLPAAKQILFGTQLQGLANVKPRERIHRSWAARYHHGMSA